MPEGPGGLWPAAQARDELLCNNPDAERQLNLFRAEMDSGRWVFVGRYAHPLAN